MTNSYSFSNDEHSLQVETTLKITEEPDGSFSVAFPHIEVTADDLGVLFMLLCSDGAEYGTMPRMRQLHPIRPKKPSRKSRS